MATDQDRPQAAFTDIDWASHEVSTLAVSRTSLVEIAVYLGIVAAFLADWLLIADGPTIGSWDVSSVEWMFIPTLAFLGFHGVLPLYRNQRLAAYYWQQFQKNTMAVVSLAFLAVVFATGIVGPMVLDPPGSVDISTRLANQYEPPVGLSTVVQGELKTGSWAYPLGTDGKGRGILKLIIFGMRVSMEVGLIAMVIAMTIGSTVGTVAAYATATGYDMVDEVLMRYVDIQSVFPVFILLLLTIYLFGPQLWYIIALYGFFGWESIARQVRGEALQRAQAEYITAARAAGANTGWIVRRHLIPNVSNTIITVATLAIPVYILGEAGLSFLGFGDPDTYSWGRIISVGKASLGEAPWISTIPGFFLFFTVLGINFVGDATLDALDPRR